MKKIYTLLMGVAFASISFAQPDQWAVAIPDGADEQAIIDGKKLITMAQVEKDGTGELVPIVVDGDLDDQWENVAPQSYTSFIQYATQYKDGAYSTKSMLDDGDNSRRLAANAEDFSGTYRFIYDEDYFYIFIDITDDEVNDGVLNPGTNEVLELQEAPYADSARDLLGPTAPYPPYTGAGHSGSEGALDRNLKYCYWGYLGAFQIHFKLQADGACETTFREKADALTKVNYFQRASACQCAWKPKEDGTNGYTAEVAISFKITLADSANNPFPLPETVSDFKDIAFEMKVIDHDLGKKQLQASWNCEDNNVWDAMIWCSKLRINGWPVNKEQVKAEKASFYPTLATDVIYLEQTAKAVEIISINGNVVKAAQNTAQVSVSDLASGLYIVKVDGEIAGKMVKE